MLITAHFESYLINNQSKKVIMIFVKFLMARLLF